MLLSRGESVHQLQRAVYTGKVAPERGRRRDEMKAISGSHALLTNIVLAWNTSRMNDAGERMRTGGIVIDDAWLRRIGPVHFGHINFQGTFRFRIDAYRLGAAAARRLIRSGRQGLKRASHGAVRGHRTELCSTHRPGKPKRVNLHERANLAQKPRLLSQATRKGRLPRIGVGRPDTYR